MNKTTVKISPAFAPEIITIYPTKESHPLMFLEYVRDLVENSGVSFEDAEKFTQKTFLEGIEMEVVYEPSHGIFLVESDAISCTNMFSPYTKKPLEEMVTPNCKNEYLKSEEERLKNLK